jgi:hypothetical protein
MELPDELKEFLREMIQNYHEEHGPWPIRDSFYSNALRADRMLELELDDITKGYYRG